MTRTTKDQKKLGKVNRQFTIKKVNDKKLKVRVKEMRKGVKGVDVRKITGSSIVDSLLEKHI